MATKRKSKPPKGYRDGGRVTGDAVSDSPVMADALPPDPVIPDSAAPVAAPAYDDAVKRAADSARAAEEWQRQAAQQMTVGDYIDAIPDLTDHKRAFLKRYPLLLRQENAVMLSRHYKAALADGVADDSAEMDDRILDGFAADLRAQREKLTPSDTMTPPPEIERSQNPKSSTTVSQDPALAPFTPPPMPSSMGLPPALPHAGPSAGRGRSMPVSAPVSREVPSASGKRISETNSIRLSALEREIARNSFGPIEGPRGEKIDLSNETKERMYAEQKARLQRERAAGIYRQTTDREG